MSDLTGHEINKTHDKKKRSFNIYNASHEYFDRVGAARDASWNRMRRTSLFLYIKLKSERKRGMQGRKSRGCRGWHPHPAENPFARNRGWLSAVVTLSSTGDAACGLHKQRLRHTGFPPPRGGSSGSYGTGSTGMEPWN